MAKGFEEAADGVQFADEDDEDVQAYNKKKSTFKERVKDKYYLIKKKIGEYQERRKEKEKEQMQMAREKRLRDIERMRKKTTEYKEKTKFYREKAKYLASKKRVQAQQSKQLSNGFSQSIDLLWGPSHKTMHKYRNPIMHEGLGSIVDYGYTKGKKNRKRNLRIL